MLICLFLLLLLYYFNCFHYLYYLFNFYRSYFLKTSPCLIPIFYKCYNIFYCNIAVGSSIISILYYLFFYGRPNLAPDICLGFFYFYDLDLGYFSIFFVFFGFLEFY